MLGWSHGRQLPRGIAPGGTHAGSRSTMTLAPDLRPVRTTAEARDLGQAAAGAIALADSSAALAMVMPVIQTRTSFALLDRVGQVIGRKPLAATEPLLASLALSGEMGAWPIIGSVLRRSLSDGFWAPLELAHGFIAAAGLWYATDILAERVAGNALVQDRAAAMQILDPWRPDPVPWVRRAVGVAVHFWAKRCAATACDADVLMMLQWLAPMLPERNGDAARGIGWALKTLGRYRPEVTTLWLRDHLLTRNQRPSSIVLRKAVTYLSERQRASVLECAGRVPPPR